MELYKELKTYGKVRANEPLSKHTTFKIGGPADFFVIVEDIDKLVDLLKFLDESGTEYFVIGGGSNMLARDEGFEGVVIKIKASNFEFENDVLIADAGCITVAMAQESIKAGLTGFEWGVGVPGTIGGAVRGNAGAMGMDMNDNLQRVEVYRDGEIIGLTNEECEFGYRNSIFKHNKDIILRAWLKLEKAEGKSEAVTGMKKALENLKYRNTTQPQGWASTGCIFKNFELGMKSVEFDVPDKFKESGKIPAGWLVEQVGMKGKKIGNAEVSERHGNFIVNLGGASSEDVLSLIEEIKDKVYDKFGIVIEEEVQII